MGTHSNTIVRNVKTGDNICLFCDSDGFLEGAGVELLDLLGKYIAVNKENTVRGIAEYIKENCYISFCNSDGINEDIDYLYVIEVGGDIPIRLKAYGWNVAEGRWDEDLTSELEEMYVKDGKILPYVLKVPSESDLNEMASLITKLNSLTPPYRNSVESLVDGLLKAINN